ncbi:MAG: hypothetical protein HWN65_07845 [Candidatus Helarchaeota archaeon]|nr:hypothetical protein [Candidatus Helarchaeota archaeon]
MSGVLMADYITMTICFVIFWGVIIFFFLYPRSQLKRTNKRIDKLEK